MLHVCYQQFHCEKIAPTRFEFKSDTALEEVKASSVPKNTARCTEWAQKYGKSGESRGK